MTDSNEIKCKNCGTSLMGEYCYQCGQERKEADSLSFRKLILYAVYELFDYDSKIFNTVKNLFLKPGLLTNEYLNGKTVKYLNPMRLYLTISLLYFLFFSFFPKHSIANLGPWVERDPSGYVKEQVSAKCQANGESYEVCLEKINVRFNEILSVTIYFVVIGYAGLLYLLFHKRRKFYVEHFIFAIHFFCYGLLRDILLEPLFFINPLLANLVAGLTSISYLVFAIKNVYGQTIRASLFYSIVIYLGFWFLACLIGLATYWYVITFG
jgi:hypothetical protein